MHTSIYLNTCVFSFAVAVREMKRIEPHPFAIIVTGDNSGHCMDSVEEVYANEREVARRIEEAFPDAVVLNVIGNNDIFPHKCVYKIVRMFSFIV